MPSYRAHLSVLKEAHYLHTDDSGSIKAEEGMSIVAYGLLLQFLVAEEPLAQGTTSRSPALVNHACENARDDEGVPTGAIITCMQAR